MKCPACHKEVETGLASCPYCRQPLHYGGNTEFYQKTVASTLTFKDIFSEVGKKHTKADWEQLFLAGTSQTTPAPGEMLGQWRRPWVFARIGVVGLIITLISYMLVSQLWTNLIPFYMVLAAALLPVTVLFFFWEMNIPRNIPFYEVLVMLLVGGFLSIFFTTIVDAVVPREQLSFLGSSIAAFTEEPAKLAAAAVFLRKKDRRYLFNGILCGVAIGAGFAMIESAGYIFNSSGVTVIGIFSGDELRAVWGEVMNGLTDMSLIRAAGNLAGHALYTGVTAGALSLALGGQPLTKQSLASSLKKAEFWKLASVSILCHFLNNSPIPTIALGPTDVSRLALSVVLWVTMFSLLKRAIRQVLAVTDTAGFKTPHPAPAGAYVGAGGASGPAHESAGPSAQAGAALLLAVSGPLAGLALPLETPLTLGRDAGSCNVIFPKEAVGVSRVHCVAELENGQLLVRDEGSTYGTFLANGTRLAPGQWVSAPNGFYLGDRQNLFCLQTGD